MQSTDKVAPQLLTSFMQQEMHKRGFLCNGSHNLSFAHTTEHIEKLLQAYQEIIPIVLEINERGNIEEYFHGVSTQPVFKVR
jgi:glutamate-1-semialdehyde 2,1-aminomutase